MLMILNALAHCFNSTHTFSVITVTFVKHLSAAVCVSLSGLVGSAYYLVAFRPDSAMAALQKATNSTVTMGKPAFYFTTDTQLLRLQ